jgi:hypothetical protein
LKHQWAVVGWSQQATPERQQPTANERLLTEVSKQHQRGNNLHPMSGCWLQEQEHHMRQRDIEAPMSGCWLKSASNTREATTYSQWAAVGCKSKSTTRGREILRHQWAVVNDREQAVR